MKETNPNLSCSSSSSSSMADTQQLHLQGNARLKEAQPKSYTRYFGKFLFFALFLIAIPLFPAQAPDFVNQTILTKFWELVHLLFIGIAVSYGLFCRRNVDVELETQPTSDDSQSYVSSVFHVSSIFEDGNDNYSYGYGERNVDQTLYSDNCKDESFVDGGSETSVVSEQNKNGSLNRGIGYENLHAFGENNMTQSWNNQYFRGESTVVVDQPNYAVNEYGLRMTHRPLGLPVRNLRSRTGSQDSPEISNGSESSSVLTDSSHSPSNHEHVNEQFGDLGPLNLEKKFNETSGSSSPIPWPSRSGRTEIRGNGVTGTHPSNFRPLSFDETQFENKFNETSGLSSPISWRSSSERMEIGENGGIGTHPSHFRPLSVDETQFESLKSQSFWSTESFSSQASSMSDSPSRLSLSGTDFSELENVKLDDTGKDKSFLRSTYPPSSSPMNGKTSLNALRIRQYTSGSLFEKKAGKSSEADLKGRSGSKRENPLGSKELRSGSLKLNEKPANLVKAYSRGKSVRSRARGYPVEAMKDEERSQNHINNKVGKAAHDEIETVYKGKNEMKNGGFDNLSTVARKQHVDNHYPMPKPALSEIQPKPALSEIQPKPAYSEIQPKSAFSEIQKRRSRERLEDFAVVSRQESEIEVENFQVKSDEEAVTNHVSDADAGFDPNEVDKKAGEFIAKFREQIRLQRVASVDKSKGRNHFR